MIIFFLLHFKEKGQEHIILVLLPKKKQKYIKDKERRVDFPLFKLKKKKKSLLLKILLLF